MYIKSYTTRKNNSTSNNNRIVKDITAEYHYQIKAHR